MFGLPWCSEGYLGFGFDRFDPIPCHAAATCCVRSVRNRAELLEWLAAAAQSRRCHLKPDLLGDMESESD